MAAYIKLRGSMSASPTPTVAGLASTIETCQLTTSNSQIYRNNLNYYYDYFA